MEKLPEKNKDDFSKSVEEIVQSTDIEKVKAFQEAIPLDPYDPDFHLPSSKRQNSRRLALLEIIRLERKKISEAAGMYTVEKEEGWMHYPGGWPSENLIQAERRKHSEHEQNPNSFLTKLREYYKTLGGTLYETNP